jgi:hypothetical protein
MNTETANQIYDVLLANCGPFPSYSNRDSFVREFTAKNHTKEWRFIGTLGFGGKFWDNNGKYYVSCYSEDETPERTRTIAVVNAKLAAIKAKENKLCQ